MSEGEQNQNHHPQKWAEVFKNRMVLFTVPSAPDSPPSRRDPHRDGQRRRSVRDDHGAARQFEAYCPGDRAGRVHAGFLWSAMIMFMILPWRSRPRSRLIRSSAKTTRSLEPLLATPITTAELLIEKAASIPAIVATYLAFAIFALASVIIVKNDVLLSALLMPAGSWQYSGRSLMALPAVAVSIMVFRR
jgi:hypothetical protein